MIATRWLPGMRLSLRLARFELVFLGVLIAAAACVTFGVAAQLDALAPPAICFEPYEVSPPPGCEASSAPFYDLQNRLGGPLLTALVGLPLLAGAMLGVTVVGRELERGTARMSWSLAPSRTRWFVGRMLPLLVAFAALVLAAGVAADRLEGAVRPGMDMSTSFEAFGSRGVIVAARAIFVFAIGVVVGALTGRVLPALLVTGVIATVGITGGSSVHQSWLRREAVVIEAFDWRSGDLYVEQRFRLPDGSLVGWEHFEGGSEPLDEYGMPRHPEVVLGIPGERYPEVQWREAGALLAGSVVALSIAALVTNRRRPG